MLDLGLDKLALVGVVALIVIGPEKLPKVARTVGHMMGKARRYVADVKAEVNRSIELEELKKAQAQFREAASEVSGSLNEVSEGLNEVQTSFEEAWKAPALDGQWSPNPQSVRKNWRVRRMRTPMWFKERTGVRRHVQSGAARVARHRPK
ncbi:Sec-independent protein translocase protein TatB [Inhella gelatinilytica]|uniref:Sec-independent protein translocase protein TatB n=1 Tax=Inhella gelatinilytica TaxID=2795030 RepID=A0A931NE34_9BURK|nr:Sec-independent protein translocase protein TatB [Inhella gelatinilytica]MBH9553264.1 Sec-independent protein translocase subunit TatB [Inhella gelatinilytica]